MKLASSWAAVLAAGVPLPCAAVPRPVPGVLVSRLAALESWAINDPSNREDLWAGLVASAFWGLAFGSGNLASAFALAGIGGGATASAMGSTSLGAGGALASGTASGAAVCRAVALTKSTSIGGFDGGNFGAGRMRLSDKAPKSSTWPKPARARAVRSARSIVYFSVLSVVTSATRFSPARFISPITAITSP